VERPSCGLLWGQIICFYQAMAFGNSNRLAVLSTGYGLIRNRWSRHLRSVDLEEVVVCDSERGF